MILVIRYAVERQQQKIAAREAQAALDEGSLV
jgi:hypothetical protein